MARKFLYVIAFCIVLYLGGRLALQFYPDQLTRLSFTPGGAFEPQPALAANAYDDPALWISRPGKAGGNPAAWLPEGYAQDADALAVPVFFVHPTSYMNKAHWNAPIDDAKSRELAEALVRANASAFNKSTLIWAPRYRQATFGAFVTDAPAARQALDLAYGDVARAFDVFAASLQLGQPFVLAGHSQGSFHVKRLLADKIKGSPLHRQLVAAYAIGWLVDTSRDLAAMGIPACAGPEATGCVVSWLSFTDGGDTAMMRNAYQRFAGKAEGAGEKPAYLCSNPITGSPGGSAPAAGNLGTLVPDAKLTTAKLVTGYAGAACAPDGTLRIGEGPEMGPFVLPGGNYHVYDVPLFWENTRADFRRRVQAWKP